MAAGRGDSGSCVSGRGKRVVLVVKDSNHGRAGHEHHHRWNELLAFVLVCIALLTCRVRSTNGDQLLICKTHPEICKIIKRKL